MNPILTFCILALASSCVHCSPCVSLINSVDSTIKYHYAQVTDSTGVVCEGTVEKEEPLKCETHGMFTSLLIHETSYTYDQLFPNIELCTKEEIPIPGSRIGTTKGEPTMYCKTSVTMIASGMKQLVLKSKTTGALFGQPPAIWTCLTAYLSNDTIIAADHQHCMAKLNAQQARVQTIYGLLSNTTGTIASRANGTEKFELIIEVCTNLLVLFAGIEPPSVHELNKLHVQEIENCASFFSSVPEVPYGHHVASWQSVANGENNDNVATWTFCNRLSGLIDKTEHNSVDESNQVPA